MLEPDDRRLLLQAFVPPEGYELDRAVGTSYSLDLMALMAAPLAFTFDDPEEEEGEVLQSPLALLHALRRHAERITLSCQAGEIKIPPVRQPLLAYVESAVVEVAAPKGGVFHPKVWLIRYVAEGKPVRMRFLCASRNLTFDRSWDALVVLDGTVANRQNAIALNHPLADFFKALPDMARKPLPGLVKDPILAMAEEARRIEWELPDDVEGIDFFPMGLANRTRAPFPKDPGKRPILIVSPFLSPDQLESLAGKSDEATLVSRAEELSKLPPDALKPFADRVYTVTGELDEAPSEGGTMEQTALTGLHAKTYVIDDGWNTRVLIGSTNATNAAMYKNVEFLVELTGKKSKLGLERLLSPPPTGQLSLYSLLRRWSPPDTTTSEVPIEEAALEQALDEWHRQLCGLQWVAECAPTESGEAFSLSLRALTDFSLLPNGTLKAWPVSLPDSSAQFMASGQSPKFCPLRLNELTAFFGFEITLTEGACSKMRRYACTATLTGAPERRFNELLASTLSGGNNFLQFVEAILATRGTYHPGGGLQAAHGVSQALSSTGNPAGAWLERILALLPSNPGAVREMGAVLEELRQTQSGRQAVPAEMLSLWNAIKPILEELPK